MIRLIRKISTITLICLLALNLAAGTAIVASPCPISICCCGPMDMNHCDGLLNFAHPMQGCSGECDDIFCDLTKYPAQDLNAVNISLPQGASYPCLSGTVDPIGGSNVEVALFEPRSLLPAALVLSPVPLYLEHLSLII